MLKQVLVLRADIKMSAGKMAAQSAHASVAAADRAAKGDLNRWKKEGQKKVVLAAKNLKELLSLKEKCIKLQMPCALISDAGLTELRSGTITALGIGPAAEEKINKITGSLPLVK